MKRHICIIISVICGVFAMATNTLTLSSVSGTPLTEVEVAVNLDNSDAIVALEMILPLEEHLKYVEHSVQLATARSNGHQVSAAQVGQDLRIYVYSLTPNALRGNTGELLKFRLLLGNEPDNYNLSPSVVLSNAAGSSLERSVQVGNVTIQAPKLQIVNTQIDYGHIPIRAKYTKNLQLKNVGNLPLTIENIITTDPLFVPKQTALTIEAQQTASVTIEYAPVERGAVNTEVVVASNAINGEQVATLVADPFSVNELHVGTASGIADSMVTVSIKMNNMEPIVAMQCAFKLPKQLEYVPNSMVVNPTRSNGHQPLSVLHGDTLVLMLYSMTNQAFHANDGDIATFQLRLNGSSGTYYLKPINVVLSNVTEENMVSATSQGKVTIKAPAISSNASINMGIIPINEEAYTTYSVRNSGSSPLVLERASFLAEGFRIVEELPITIATYKTTTITVAYQPVEEGDFSTTMNLYTSDPNNRLKTVTLSGQVFEPNELTLDGKNQTDGSYMLSVGLKNYTDIVAVQYDVHWRSDMTTAQAAFTPSERMSSHSYSVTPLGEDSYRVLIYSMSNAVIDGNEGELHQLLFTPQGEIDYCGNTITVDNVVLSNANGKDKTSVKSTSLHVEQTQWVNDTVAACNQYEWNGKVYTESGIYKDTLLSILGCDSIVTLYLTVNKSVTNEMSITTCDHYTWSNGVTYTTSGIYYDSLHTIHGCDSVEILTLTINYSDTAFFSATACDSYVWHDETYTTSGTYEYLTQTVHGCGSLEVLTLTVNRSVTSEETYVSCDSYTWNGETYSESGEYVYTTVAANGCDSIVTLHLTILPDATTESETLALCLSELPYEWYGQSLTEEGTYSATEPYAGMECDSVIHQLNLQIYVQTLPLAVTPPVVYAGKKIDVSVPTEEIQAFINAETLYAPQSTIKWYVKNNTEWQLLTDEIINFESSQIELKYVVETDCGNQESTSMSITILTTNLEEAISQESVVKKVIYDNNIYIIRNGVVYTIIGQKVD